MPETADPVEPTPDRLGDLIKETNWVLVYELRILLGEARRGRTALRGRRADDVIRKECEQDIDLIKRFGIACYRLGRDGVL